MKNPRVVLCVCVIAVMSVSASAQQDSAPLTVPDLPDFNNHATPEISLGAPVRVVNPVLPKKLRKRDIVSVLETTIEQDGSLSDLNIAGGDQAFGELLLDAVRHWQYAPALVRGNPVKAPVFLIVTSHEGKLNSRLEMNPSFPTNPKIRLEDQIADGALFKIDSKTGHFQSDSNAVHPPKPLIQPSPGYSEAARIANFQGVLVLGVIVGRDGSPQDVWVVKKLGLGLDQKAIEMVQNWRFLPATKDGKPVAVPINIEVTFKLY